MTAIEFAFVAPLLFLLSMGTIEVGLMMFNMSTIEGGLREAARYGVTGQEATSGERKAEIVAVLKRYAIGPVEIDPSRISTKVYTSFGNIGQPEPYTDTNGNGQYDQGEPYTDVNVNHQWDADQGADSPGSGNEIVQYKVDYDWDVLTPIMRQFLGKDGKMPMTATVVVQNEPCPVGSTCKSGEGGWQN
ncbi:TadE/TadG family type IV pilus assembly protein [Dongia soli]|uniref:TadE/TadG family type IV pilus assembly protein n=1 Tax=Dongia soli TaxID=600628 RepID=A0ABU5EAK9_9PROT|nr:TadE/TadG family type IV pilus assembly protein [Dongia soli]MDY0883289.1 TadE/TadG family type IV pilus assembly protein [Dongia soli]